MEHRRSQRFSLCLPVAVTRSGPERMTRSGLTRNISSGGVLFVSEQAPELGGAIEYIITLDPNARRRVDIRCIGTVLRCGRDTGNPAFAYEIAATLERYEFLRAD